ncbi:MAG: cytochrome c [Azonexus sp.]
MRWPTILLSTLLAWLPAPAALSADLASGQRLHDKQCISCHAKQYGGDGSGMYRRPDSLIHDRPALERRVAICNKMTGAGLSPDDEKNISAYLEQRYYKFRP